MIDILFRRVICWMTGGHVWAPVPAATDFPILYCVNCWKHKVIEEDKDAHI